MPIEQIEGEEVPDNVYDFINNCIPIFYLKYVDDLGDYSDTKETIGVILDIVLTFSGVGNIYKLKHLKNVSKLRNLLTDVGLDDAAKLAIKLELKKSFSVSLSGIQAIISVVNLAFNLSTARCSIYYGEDGLVPEEGDPEYDDFIFCHELQKWLFILEMVSLSGDLLARRAFKRATKRFKERIPAHQDFDEIREALELLDDLDAMLLEFIDSLDPAILSKINTLSEEEKVLFIINFRGRKKSLQSLAGDPTLIDEWAEFTTRYHRKYIKVLDLNHGYYII